MISTENIIFVKKNCTERANTRWNMARSCNYWRNWYSLEKNAISVNLKKKTHLEFENFEYALLARDELARCGVFV
jgi:hypothetical protein